MRSGYEAAKYHGVTTESGMMNYLALAFVLGSGFDRDPLSLGGGGTERSVVGRSGARGAALRKRPEGSENVCPLALAGPSRAPSLWPNQPNPTGGSSRRRPIWVLATRHTHTRPRSVIEQHLSDITRVIQLSVAPAFLLVAMGTLINILAARLARIVDRRRVVQNGYVRSRMNRRRNSGKR